MDNKALNMDNKALNMDNKSEILEIFESKMIESIEEKKILINRNKDLSKRVLESHHLIQTSQQRVQSEAEKSRQLNDLLIRKSFDSNIEIESKTYALNEEKALNLTQIDSLSEQNNGLKRQLNSLQKKCLDLDQSLTQSTNQLQIQTTFKTTIGSELSRFQTKIESIVKDLKTIDRNHCELKDFIKVTNDSNIETTNALKQQNDELVSLRAEHQCLKKQLNELLAKYYKTEKELNEKVLLSLRFTQQNDLQKQEMFELRQMFDQLLNENQNLTKSLNEMNISLGLSENQLKFEEISETIDENIKQSFK